MASTSPLYLNTYSYIDRYRSRRHAYIRPHRDQSGSNHHASDHMPTSRKPQGETLTLGPCQLAWDLYIYISIYIWYTHCIAACVIIYVHNTRKYIHIINVWVALSCHLYIHAATAARHKKHNELDTCPEDASTAKNAYSHHYVNV